MPGRLSDPALAGADDGAGVWGLGAGAPGVSCLGALAGFSGLGAGSGSLAAGSSLGVGVPGSPLVSLGADCFSAPPSGAAPGSMRARSWPTVTVSSSLTRSSFNVPASVALTATSI